MRIRRARTEDAAALAEQMSVVVEEGRWLASESNRTLEELTDRFNSALEDGHTLHARV